MLIVAVVISGHLLPWSMGRPLERFGLGLPSPMAANPELHAFLEQVHDTAGRLFVRWLALHAVGAVKHAVFDPRGVALRMISDQVDTRWPSTKVAVDEREIAGSETNAFGNCNS